MNKKIIAIIICIFFLITIFSGCNQQEKKPNKNNNIKTNQLPIGIITAPEKAYFGEAIEFSAANSFDTDGNITCYDWDFGNEGTNQGEVIYHTFDFEKDFTINYPLIYPVNLFVTDNDGGITATTYQIKIYPKVYSFFLMQNSISIDNKTSNNEKIRASGLFKFSSPKILTYSFEKSILISKCTWNLTINVKKPIFAILNKISIELIDESGDIISSVSENLVIFSLWKNKEIILKGSVGKDSNFKTLKISFSGLSIRKEITIIYGGNNPSILCFNKPVS